jgi:acetyl esterase/lipase
MTKYLAPKYLVLFFLLAAITGASVRGAEAEFLSGVGVPIVKVGLVADESGAPPVDAPLPVVDAPAPPAAAAPPPADAAASSVDAALPPTPDQPNPCESVSFSRSLKYGESDLNVLDVATIDSKEASRRPVLLFVAGESFAGESVTPDSTASLQDEAMCFAARNGMVGVKMAYRLAPANPWPAGTQDVAAAASWVHQNIDLFGGNPEEIVAVGYSTGAFHVASFLAHPQFQASDSNVAGAVLVSGLYSLSADASATEKSYFGADASKYEDRSVFPGILSIDTPLLLAWSALDPPRLVAQGEKLKELLCHSIAHCPHSTVLKERASLASVFARDAAGGSLAEPTLELIREIEARGLP